MRHAGPAASVLPDERPDTDASAARPGDSPGISAAPMPRAAPASPAGNSALPPAPIGTAPPPARTRDLDIDGPGASPSDPGPAGSGPAGNALQPSEQDHSNDAASETERSIPMVPAGAPTRAGVHCFALHIGTLIRCQSCSRPFMMTRAPCLSTIVTRQFMCRTHEHLSLPICQMFACSAALHLLQPRTCAIQTLMLALAVLRV